MISETITLHFQDDAQQKRFHERLSTPEPGISGTWTEGVCDDGAAILRDGVPVSISALLSILNAHEAAIASEREACAKIAHEASAWCRAFSSEEAAEMIEAAIRSRGEKT